MIMFLVLFCLFMGFAWLCDFYDFERGPAIGIAIALSAMMSFAAIGLS